MAIINSSIYLLQVGGSALADQTEGSISLSAEELDISTKSASASGFKSIQLGQRSATISVSGLVADSADAVDTLMTHYAARSSFAVIFGADGDTEHNFTGNAFVTSLEVSGGVEDNVTYSATLVLTGSIALDTTAE